MWRRSGKAAVSAKNAPHPWHLYWKAGPRGIGGRPPGETGLEPSPAAADGASPCSWQPIMKFINDQYEKYLQEEVNINRKKRIPDTRVHCCLYFIPATGHS